MGKRAADEEPERVLAGSSLKVNKDGDKVLSDTLYPGERLASEDAAKAERPGRER